MEQSKECDHIWTRIGWTTSYKTLEATTHKGEHRIATDPTWFWPLMQCKACKKIRIHKIYISKEDVENGSYESSEETGDRSLLELPVYKGILVRPEGEGDRT